MATAEGVAILGVKGSGPLFTFSASVLRFKIIMDNFIYVVVWVLGTRRGDSIQQQGLCIQESIRGDFVEASFLGGGGNYGTGKFWNGYEAVGF